MNQMILMLEIIGTIAFSLSGAIAAIEKEMDLLGISIMGLITAVGGGIIRDITLDITPPNAFTKPIYFTISIITIFTFIFLVLIYKHKSDLFKHIKLNHLKNAINVSDAIGLGAFTITGVNIAIQAGYQDNFLLLLFVGMITGVGGGILRDVFTSKTPYIFVKHIYGVASLIGAAAFIFLRQQINPEWAMLLCAGLIMIIRFISAKYKLSLPKISIKKKP